MICTSHQTLFWWWNREEWCGRACSTYGGKERCIQCFDVENWGKQSTWKTQA